MALQPLSIRTNLISGQGSLAEVAEVADRRVFLVTDPGIVAAGHVARLEAMLQAKGTACYRFDGVQEKPRAADVQRSLEVTQAD